MSAAGTAPVRLTPEAAWIGTWASIGFVPLWSSGIVFGALAIRSGPPFEVTALRFAAASLLLGALAVVRHARWPRGAGLGHAAMVGLLLQGGHYGGIYAGIAAGMPAGVAALIVGLIPVATALGAVPVLGERFTRRRATAAFLGGAAALLISWSQLRLGSAIVLALAAIALGGGAGAALWQKRFGSAAADVPSAAVQLAVGTAVMTACWFGLERGGRGIAWGPSFIAPFVWTVVANSVGATLLLLWLLARGAAGRVTGLFFLVPPVTALAAAPILGEWPRPTTLIAILLGTAAVWLLLSERPGR